jgi:hypothetical protein
MPAQAAQGGSRAGDAKIDGMEVDAHISDGTDLIARAFEVRHGACGKMQIAAFGGQTHSDGLADPLVAPGYKGAATSES